MNGRESSERVCIQWGQRLFERIQEDIDSERDRITSTFQAMLNNAKVIARLNDFYPKPVELNGVPTAVL